MRALTQNELKEALRYDPETGVFVRIRRSRGPKSSIGDVAGCTDSTGYVKIMVNGQRHCAHRLAWLYMTGEWPTFEIDHKNRIRDDNRFDNLRRATHSQNSANTAVRRNNKAGLKGVHFDKCSNKWKAQICIAGKKRHLGLFATAELGAEFYELAAQMLFGGFAG